jgi:hypothetical protein
VPATEQRRIDGVELAVLVAGDGPAVLLLHGFPDTHALWPTSSATTSVRRSRGCSRRCIPDRVDHLVAMSVGHPAAGAEGPERVTELLLGFLPAPAAPAPDA